MLSIGRPDVHQCDSGWVPVYTDAEKNLALMSIGFLLEDPDEAVVWRGPKKTGMLFTSCVFDRPIMLAQHLLKGSVPVLIVF